ncbi:hypothetical protein BLNAU_961 [Blattamonas nauphoetae]|uniref:Uncharacterized protein n=1 Tax=Blattamonas nauphoetae TaxID=2049346 RepID=A0ABQ9YJE4_9EUKA|nr:hypothetical protein BLNAU_961 [Blattamonas nauphoetae]
MSFLNKMKAEATKLQQKASMSIHSVEKTEETAEFKTEVKKLDTLRDGLERLETLASAMKVAHQAAHKAELEYLESYGKYCQEDLTLPKEVSVLVDKLKAATKHYSDYITALDEGILKATTNFCKEPVGQIHTLERELDKMKTTRDYKTKDKQADGTWKVEASKQEWETLDQQYKAKREILLRQIAWVSGARDRFVVETLGNFQELKVLYHSNSGEEMKHIKEDVEKALAEVKPAPERPPVS